MRVSALKHFSSTSLGNCQPGKAIKKDLNPGFALQLIQSGLVEPASAEDEKELEAWAKDQDQLSSAVQVGQVLTKNKEKPLPKSQGAALKSQQQTQASDMGESLTTSTPATGAGGDNITAKQKKPRKSKKSKPVEK